MSSLTKPEHLMQFRECSINSKTYGHNGWAGKTDAEKEKKYCEGNEQTPETIGKTQKTYGDLISLKTRKVFAPKYASTDPSILTFVDPELFKDLQRVRNKDNGLGKVTEKRIFYALGVNNIHITSVQDTPASPPSSPSPGSKSSGRDLMHYLDSPVHEKIDLNDLENTLFREKKKSKN
ncbi:7028_t:CDS:1 [Paraglomus brasilianum]|uniref:7028_t:CDS:1 n=1 Tax=Paraglomus brasilianum TaxID=144538 RepID=A0A9N9ACL7_9GLOM|nr:7028_t:CDS:1 [Paraglomus brasilianum]